MRRFTTALVLLLVLGLASMSIIACQPEQPPSAADQVQEQIEESTTEQQESVEGDLEAVRDKINELITAGDGLETRVDGLQVKSDLRELERKLTAAMEEAGDKKVAAIEEISDGLNNLIYRVETAAGKATPGGEVETKLTDFATKLKDAQAQLGAAAASAEASATP